MTPRSSGDPKGRFAAFGLLLISNVSQRMRIWHRNLIAFALFAGAIPSALYFSGEGPLYKALRDRGAPAQGLVVSTDCYKSLLFEYNFIVEGRTFSGSGRGTCGTIAAGNVVAVFYLPDEPEKNKPTDDPAVLFHNTVWGTAVGGVLAALFLTAVFHQASSDLASRRLTRRSSGPLRAR